MTEKFFVDTNVLVYAHQSADSAKQAVAVQWIDRLWREESGRISVQVLNELYTNLVRKLSHLMSSDQAWKVVSRFMEWRPLPLDRNLLQRAHKIEQRYRIHWWDSLIVAAAQFQDCNVLLTEDLQPGMVFDRVTVQNPFSMQVREPSPAYSIARPSSRHRPQRRPRKRSPCHTASVNC